MATVQMQAANHSEKWA